MVEMNATKKSCLEGWWDAAMDPDGDIGDIIRRRVMRRSTKPVHGGRRDGIKWEKLW